MSQLQQVQSMLQSYQAQMDEINKFLQNPLGKAPEPAAQPEAPPAIADIPEPDQLSAEQHKMLLSLFKSFISDDQKDGARELTSGLMKFGRYAQSMFDKLKAT